MSSKSTFESNSKSPTPKKKVKALWTMEDYTKQAHAAQDLSQGEWANFYIWANKVKAGKHPKIAAEEAGDMNYNCLSKCIGHYEVCLSEEHKVSFFQNKRNHIVAIHQIGGMDQELAKTQVERTRVSISGFNSPTPPNEKAEVVVVTTTEDFTKLVNKAKDLNEVEWAKFNAWVNTIKERFRVGNMEYTGLKKDWQYEVRLSKKNIVFFLVDSSLRIKIHQIGGHTHSR